MKRIVLMLTTALLLMICGCERKEEEKDAYRRVYDAFCETSQFHLQQKTKLRYVYDYSMLTTNTEAELYLDREMEYFDLTMTVYEKYDAITQHYLLKDGIMMMDHGSTEATLQDMEPLLETISLIIPDPSDVMSKEVVEALGEYEMTLQCSEEFKREVARTHGGDVIEQFDFEVESFHLKLCSDENCRITEEKIEFELLVKDSEPFHLNMYITIEVLPYVE